MRRPDFTPRPEPTPQEIARRAAAIREEWSPREEAIRAGRDPKSVMTVPVVTTHMEGMR